MALPAVTHLLYLHGFRSSPQSTKARRLLAWLSHHRPEVVWRAPQLPASPAQAMQVALAACVGWPPAMTAVVGSSLGGFYATAVAQTLGCRAVLLNPAVDPARDLATRVGTLTAWHSDEPFVFEPGYVEELRAMAPLRLSDHGRLFAIIAKGDEVLDWREMAARYAGCPMKLVEGSDHALSDFDSHLADVLRFLGLE